MDIEIKKIFNPIQSFVLSVAFLSLFGCSASTNFIPPKDHQVYLALKDGQLIYIKDSTIIMIPDSPYELFNCDSLAQLEANEGIKSIESGVKKQVALGIFQGIIPLIRMFQGQAEVHTGTAKLIDAMNIHNDQSECISHEFQKEDEDLIIPSMIEISYNRATSILNRKMNIKCVKKKESLFFSTITLFIEGIIGIDKNRNGSFEFSSIIVKQYDKFYIKTKTLLLYVEVLQTNDNGITLSFQK